jgi:antitoxin ParD1/3/4/toxin ParE1/3/4
MPDYSVTLAAQGDIEDIIWTIGESNPKAAERFEEKLYRAFGLLASNPALGHSRFDLTDRPVLFWTVRKSPYAVIYRNVLPIEIVRVVHWRRDIEALLLDE